MFIHICLCKKSVQRMYISYGLQSGKETQKTTLSPQTSGQNTRKFILPAPLPLPPHSSASTQILSSLHPPETQTVVFSPASSLLPGLSISSSFSRALTNRLWFAELLTDCLASGKWLQLLNPQFPYLTKGGNKFSLLGLLVMVKWNNLWKTSGT